MIDKKFKLNKKENNYCIQAAEYGCFCLKTENDYQQIVDYMNFQLNLIHTLSTELNKYKNNGGKHNNCAKQEK